MLDYICLLLPAVLAVWVFEKLMKQELKVKPWLVFYGVQVLLVNFAVLMIMRLLLGQPSDHIGNFYVYTATSYLIMAIPIAIVSGAVFAMLTKKVSIEVEDDSDGK